jgi:hypothetical protein
MTPNHRAALQRNVRVNLVRTLENLSSQERQIKYKADVPYVHVPQELLAQCNDYTSLLKEQREWFIQSLSESEMAAIIDFDHAVRAFDWEGSLPDVPPIFELPRWVRLMEKATELLLVLKSNRVE